jgi:hypothetical protein
MKLKQKLQHPFALIAEGFIAGAILLYATTPADVRQQSVSSLSAPAEQTQQV